jgi:hypothetical protein
MKYGFVLPMGDARAAAELAHLAESAGWDGFFVWEPVWGIDAWVCLAAAAMTRSYLKNGNIWLKSDKETSRWTLQMNNGTSSNLSFQNLRNGPMVVADLGATTEKSSTEFCGSCALVRNGKICLSDIRHTRLAIDVSRNGFAQERLKLF